MKNYLSIILITLFFVNANGQNDQLSSQTNQADELAKQLQNPLASLISVPFQGNYDFGIDPAEGERFLLNIQPVVPMSISEDWNIIGRVILPFVSQNNVFGESGRQTGLGDALITGFFSPKAPTKGGLIWGVGPAFQVPTATDIVLGTEKFSVGPSAVGLKQAGSFTLGLLVNHLWSVAGNDKRADVDNTFFQPFIAKNFKGGYALTFNTELLQDWNRSNANGTINIVASRVMPIGKQLTQFLIGPRIPYGNANDADWGIRGGFVLLFPK
jgi:hypothetical protein